MLFIVFVVPFVLSPINPSVNPISMFLIVQPRPVVPPSVLPLADAFPFDSTVYPLSHIHSPISQVIDSLTVPFALFEHSLVLVSIRVCLDSGAMLHVVLPVSLILGSRFEMNINTIAMSLVVFPLSIVGVSFHMRKLALPRSFSFQPLTFIFGSVRPDLQSMPTLQSSHPLTLVLDSTLQDNHTLFLGGLVHGILGICIDIVVELGLVFGKILAVFTDNKAALNLLLWVGFGGRWVVGVGRQLAVLDWTQLVLGWCIYSITNCALIPHLFIFISLPSYNNKTQLIVTVPPPIPTPHGQQSSILGRARWG